MFPLKLLFRLFGGYSKQYVDQALLLNTASPVKTCDEFRGQRWDHMYYISGHHKGNGTRSIEGF